MFNWIFRGNEAVLNFLCRPSVRRVLLVLLPLLITWFLFRKAWVAEDAYITFRTVVNAVEGYGLRWNIGERVQVYTHPLWMLLHIPLYAITQEIYYTTTALSFLLAIGGYLLLQRTYADRPLVLLAAIAIPLLSLTPFFEFSVSGLENPLSNFLLIVFYLLFLRRQPTPWFALVLTASLLVLNRFDLILLVLPPALFLALTEWRHIRWPAVLAGLLPLAGWCAFSLLYYGFVFPNTKYAKLHTGVAASDNIRQSYEYFIDFLRNGTPGFFTLLLLLGLFFYLLIKRPRAALRTRWMMGGFAILLYLAYITWVGSDYMSGRFFVAPFMVAIILLAEHLVRHPLHERQWVSVLFTMLLLTNLYGFHYRTLDIISQVGIANERYFYRMSNTLLGNLTGTRNIAKNEWVQEGKDLAEQAKGLSGMAVLPNAVVRGNAGMMPYYAGPHVLFIDPFGLAEPLLARLPLLDKKSWRIGHFFRLLPEGYQHFRETGDASQMDPDLAVYAQAMFTVIQAPFWDAKRLRTLVDFQRGKYDPYLVRYVATMGRTDWPLSRLDSKRTIDLRSKIGNPIADARDFVVSSGTVYTFRSPKLVRAQALHFSSLQQCAFQYRFFKGEAEIGYMEIDNVTDGIKTDGFGQRYGEVLLPEKVRREGFDRVELTSSDYAHTRGNGMLPLIFYSSFR